ncbi:hypothetical protein M501DRAFT_1017951 [Patellaria atrata CBS 101060]|uniref:Uncharacterized protein n=1 Tax=Patellaria atrata CBS 101060 TaxID=1346257 RepID=A0A9P4S817_9PEZI|nr:hypothetical protein M501DRAFT_1017951 [Patellaria atrata CBS 101060]
MANPINNLLNPQPNVNVHQLLGNLPQHDIQQDNWGFLDFQNGRTWYTCDEKVGLQYADIGPNKLIGTTGLASCTAIMIANRNCAIVGHFSPGTGTNDFRNFVINPSWLHRLQGANTGAWIFHASKDQGENVPHNDNSGTWLDVKDLRDILLDDLHLDELNIGLLMYKPPVEGSPLGTGGEETVMVDGRNSPGLFPQVYAQGFNLLT